MKTEIKTKETKRLSILGMAALMAAAVSCKKGDGDATAPMQGAFHAVAEAQAGDSKTSLSNLNVVWSSSDRIRVFNNSYNQGDFTLTSGATTSSGEFDEVESPGTGFYTDNYYAFYPTNVAHGEGEKFTMTLPADQTYADNSFGNGVNPMAARAYGSSLEFKNLCGTLRLKLAGNLSNILVTSIKVTTTKEERLNGNGTVTFTGVTPALDMSGTPGNGEKSVTLTCPKVAIPRASADPAVDAYREFNIVLPAGTLGGGFEVVVTYDVNGVKTGCTFTKKVNSSVNNSIAEGRIRLMPTLRIDYGFVVDTKGTTVEFAPGNLYWNGSQWNIESNQWNHPDSWNNNYVSHLFWSSNSTIVYMPTYSDPQASASDKFFTELNSFSVSSGNKSYNHTLSKAEWEYVMNARPVQFSRRWASAVISTTDRSKVKGMFLFPAEWTKPASGYDWLDTGGGWGENNVVEEDKLTEDFAGCVFLPAGGYRDNANVKNVGLEGTYWSSTPDDNAAWRMVFRANTVDVGSLSKGYGCSMRLVRVL